MSTLVQDILENDAPISQTFRITKGINVAHIRPWVYFHNDLIDGDLKLEILEGPTVLAVSTIIYEEINDGKQDDYVHGWIRFDFKSLQLNVPENQPYQEYILRLSMTNHTDDPNSFVAWNREWDFAKYDNYGSVDLNGDPVNDMVAPFGFELYIWDNRNG